MANRAARRNKSISGFLIPARTRDSYYLVAVVRNHNTRQRRMDLALCHALQPIFTSVLSRLEDGTVGQRVDPDGRVPMIGQRLLSDFCSVLKERVEGSSVLLLYADEDLEALSLKDNDGASESAEQIGLIPPSELSLATKCYSDDMPLYGRREGEDLIVYRLGQKGEPDTNSFKCPYLRWLPNVAWAIAAPLHSGMRKFGVVIVAWDNPLELTTQDLQRYYREVAELCKEFGELTHENCLKGAEILRKSQKPLVHKLRQVPDPSLVPDKPFFVSLPPELDQLFPRDFRSVLDELLDRFVSEMPCLSVTMRLANHSRSGLFLIGRAGRPGSELMYSLEQPPSSVLAYCFLNHQKYAAISLPRIRDGKPSIGNLYPGLVYAKTREETQSELCIPLVSRSGNKDCLGTLNFESSEENGFQQFRDTCEELRWNLEDIVVRRISSARSELFHHIEYMGHLFAQEHHALKDRFTMAEKELIEGANSAFVPRIRKVFATHRKQFVDRIKELDTLSTRQTFHPAKSVNSVLSRILSTIENLLDVQVEMDSSILTFGNRWLFEHAVENTLWQVFTFLQAVRLPTPSHRFKLHIILKRLPTEHACLLAIAHDGPPISPELGRVHTNEALRR